MSQMTPREIVQELDEHIISQSDAKRAVAIANNTQKHIDDRPDRCW
jgi:ATP-dependent protease HslVU (ClpYQ) ATPase subunit